jgi:hypothetical protein
MIEPMHGIGRHQSQVAAAARTSTPRVRVVPTQHDLGAIAYGAELCYFSAIGYGAEQKVQK